MFLIKSGAFSTTWFDPFTIDTTSVFLSKFFMEFSISLIFSRQLSTFTLLVSSISSECKDRNDYHHDRNSLRFFYLYKEGHTQSPTPQLLKSKHIDLKSYRQDVDPSLQIVVNLSTHQLPLSSVLILLVRTLSYILFQLWYIHLSTDFFYIFHSFRLRLLPLGSLGLSYTVFYSRNTVFVPFYINSFWLIDIRVPSV